MVRKMIAVSGTVAGKDRGFRVHWAWVVLGSSFITLFVTYGIRIGAYSVLLPEMIKDLQITKTQAGMIKSAFSMVYLILAPLMGWLTDRIGGRKVISFFCLFLGGGTFLMGKAESLTAAVIFYSIVGIGASATWVPIVVLMQHWFGEKKRGLALGILSPSYGIGFGLMGLILPVIVLEYHWRVGWFILGIAGLVLIFLNGLFLRDRPEKVALLPWGESVGELEGTALPPAKMGSFDLLKKGRLWIIGMSYFAISYGTYTLVDFIVTYGVIELSIPYPVASLFISVIAFSGVIGGFLLMILSDYIGRKKSLMIIQTIVMVGILFILLAGHHISLMLLGTGIFGFVYGAIWPMYGACARDYFPKDVSGTVFGLMTIFYGVGAMVSPVLTGLLADVTGTFRWSFGLGALASLMAAVLIGFLGKPREFEKQRD
jgi:MFS family permease